MNKKLSALALCMLITGVCVSGLRAQKDVSKPQAQETAQSEEELALKRAALVEKTVQTLKSKEWTIYVTVKPAIEKKPALIETDALTFTDRIVLSKNLSARGYSKNGSNYSLSVSDDGMSAVWETMQMHENGQDIAFLRGELNIKSDVMAGGIVFKSAKGKSESHPYTTVKPAEMAPVESIAAAAAGKPEESKKSKNKKEKEQGS